MTRATPLLLTILLLSACGIDVRNRPATRWTGSIAPTTPSSRCPTSRAVLVMQAKTFTFAPDEGTWLLEGPVTANSLNAKRTRPTPDHKSYETELRATWTPDAVHGTYTTPFCDYKVDLTPF